jgi:hypothetical protein
MKRFLIIAIVLSLMLALAACGGNTSEVPTPPNVTPDTNEPVTSITNDSPITNAPSIANDPPIANEFTPLFNVGNTPANIQNGGRAAIYGGWVYYIDNAGNLSRMKEDGTEKTILNNRDMSRVRYINIVNNIIYYVDYTDDYSIIYSSSLDGTVETVIFSDANISILNLTVVDDWLYYESVYKRDNPADVRDEFIHRMRLDGIEHTQLSDVRSQDMMISDGWIYFHGYIDWVDDVYIGTNYIYKMRLDGSESSRFNDALDGMDDIPYGYYSITSFVVDGGWIYYITGDYNELYRIRTNFSEKTKVYEGESGMILTTVNISGDRLYLTDTVPVAHVGDLLSINSAGEKQTVLSDVSLYTISGFMIIGDWIYYNYHGADDYGFLRMRLDGTGRERVE